MAVSDRRRSGDSPEGGTAAGALCIKSRSSRETALLRERREISLRGDEIRDTFLQTRDVVENARLTASARLWCGERLESWFPTSRCYPGSPRPVQEVLGRRPGRCASRGCRCGARNPDDVSVPEPLLADDGAQPGATPFVPYCVANEGAEVSLRSDLVAAEYNALERAVRSHALIQNAVAAAVV